MSIIAQNDVLDVEEYLELWDLRRKENLTPEGMLKYFEQNDLSPLMRNLTEIDDCIRVETPVVIVRFPYIYGGYVYRLCEMPCI